MPFDQCPDLLVRQRDIDRNTHRLMDVPRGIDEDFRAMPFEIAKVDRNCIAVGDAPEGWPLHDHLFRTQAPLHGAQLLERPRTKRQLLDDIERQPLGAACRQDHLMMLSRVAGEKGNFGTVVEDAAITQRETHHPGVEVDHGADVAHEYADMAESEGHGLDQDDAPPRYQSACGGYVTIKGICRVRAPAIRWRQSKVNPMTIKLRQNNKRVHHDRSSSGSRPTSCRRALHAPTNLVALLIALLTLSVIAPACAQDAPQRPIRLIVPNAPGGGTDIIARHVAQFFAETLRQPMIVENRVGGGSLAGTDYVAKAAPDGQTLLLGGVSSLALNPALFRNLPYDPLRDFVAVGFLAAYPFVLVARPDLPGSSLADLARLARANPGKLSFGSAGVGTVQHVWATILVRSLGLDMVHVPYKGAAPAVQDMIGGRVDIMFDNLSAARTYVDSGRLKALAVSSTRRAEALPAVPTVEETGLVKFSGESWFGVFAPSQTPTNAVERLRGGFAALSRSAEFAARVEHDTGRTMPIPAAEQQAFLRGEIERWARLVARYEVSAD